MSQMNAIPERDQVSVEETWNLTDLYADDAAWQAEFEVAQTYVDKLSAYAGRLGESGATLLEYLELCQEADTLLNNLANYAYRKGDQDTRVAQYQAMEGKISSLASIMRFLKNSHEEYVLLSDCDTVANIDYKEVFALHTAKEADITIVYRHGTSPDTDKNVVYTVDPEGFIRDMVVKRGSDTDCNFGMGMCLIGRKRLMAMIEECMGRNLYDFDRDLLQRNLPELRVVGYEFTGAAYCISSLGSYFKANMALMEPKVRTQLFEPSRPVYTKVRDDMPTRYGLGSVVSNSIVADGCLIEGEVENCVLFRGVQVHKGAKLRNCVIMQDAVIGENSRLDFVVADKDTIFDPNRTLMGYQTYPVFVAKGSKV